MWILTLMTSNTISTQHNSWYLVKKGLAKTHAEFTVNLNMNDQD